MERNPGKKALLKELEATCRSLSAARSGFDGTGDGDLLEYYLYEISALRARHTYLLRQLKQWEEKEGPL